MPSLRYTTSCSIVPRASQRNKELRRLAKKEKTKESIISAAEKIFARDGFHQARIRDIEQEAGVSEKKFYSFFTKDEVLNLIFERTWGAINQSVEKCLKEKVDIIERLKRILSIILRFFEENRETKLVFIGASRELGELGRTLMMGEIRKLITVIESTFADGQKQGVFRKDLNAKSMQRAFFGTIEEFIHSSVLKETTSYRTEYTQEQLEKTIESMLEGFSEKAVGK